MDCGKKWIIMESADSFRNKAFYDVCGIEIIDNTEHEFLEAVKEMLKLIENKLNIDETVQERFKKLFPKGYPLREQTGYVSPYFMRKYKEIFQ